MSTVEVQEEGINGLRRRPVRYASGPDLPVGTYHVQLLLSVPAWTVVRTIGAERWYQLTARENPAWKTWATRAECIAAVSGMPGFGGGYFDICDWPHWGQP